MVAPGIREISNSSQKPIFSLKTSSLSMLYTSRLTAIAKIIPSKKCYNNIIYNSQGHTEKFKKDASAIERKRLL